MVWCLSLAVVVLGLAGVFLACLLGQIARDYDAFKRKAGAELDRLDQVVKDHANGSWSLVECRASVKGLQSDFEGFKERAAGLDKRADDHRSWLEVHGQYLQALARQTDKIHKEQDRVRAGFLAYFGPDAAKDLRPTAEPTVQPPAAPAGRAI